MASGNLFFCVNDFGAVGNGVNKDTYAINKTIEKCAEQNGGTVFIPAGRYLTGSIYLKNNINLHLDRGAVILASEDEQDYPLVTKTMEIDGPAHASLIYGENLTNISVTGGGTIDGRGGIWWKKALAGKLHARRPHIFSCVECKDVLLRDLTLLNSPCWTVRPVFSENLTIDNLTLRNPYEAPNTDGINPDSCRNVRISNCNIDVGDDCITIKSGRQDDTRKAVRPCENITITNCTMVHGHGGVVMGSEMTGGIRNVVISNCVFTSTDRGIRMKSKYGRGGVVEDIRVNNIIMRDVACPFTFNLHYGTGVKPSREDMPDAELRPVSEATPIFRNLFFSNITSRATRAAAGFMVGLREMPLTGLTFDNIEIEMATGEGIKGHFPADWYGQREMTGKGFLCRNIKDIAFRNITIKGTRYEAMKIDNAEAIIISGLYAGCPADSQLPAVELNQTTNAVIQGCKAAPDTGAFLKVKGVKSKNILFVGNYMIDAKQSVTTDADVSSDTVLIT